MSDLNISQKNIYTIFTERGGKFLIPDYQRPYSWGREECETLLEDLKNFALPEDGEEFDEDKDEYFLGTIVTFKNEFDQNEVIDGQQHLITLSLLLRAYYEAFSDKNDAPTFNPELQNLADNFKDFTELDIVERNQKIFDAFISYLDENNLLR